MSFVQTVLLSAFAGGTIFLGLPVGRVRGLSTRWQAALTTAAAGVILFLIYDVLSQAVEPVTEALDAARTGTGSSGQFALYAAVLGGSVAFGLLSVTYLTQRMTKRGARVAMTPRQVALGTAVGLGLHNFSEGFAIGAPLSQGERPTWSFLGGAGAIGGGPTFLGGVLGYSIVSPLLSIAFLGLAAGALIFVFNEMMAVARRFSLPMVTGVALTLGLLIALGTDFVLTAAGA